MEHKWLPESNLEIFEGADAKWRTLKNFITGANHVLLAYCCSGSSLNKNSVSL